MGRFATLNENVIYIMNLLLQNQNLCKLLYYQEDNPLSQPNINNPSVLLHKNILPYPKNPNSIPHKDTILVCEFDEVKNSRDNYKISDCRIVFNILVHLDKFPINEGVRPLLIADELDNIFGEKRDLKLSMWKTIHDGFRKSVYSDYYHGYVLSYKITGLS